MSRTFRLSAQSAKLREEKIIKAAVLRVRQRGDRMEGKKSCAKKAAVVEPGSSEEEHYAEEGYIISGGPPVCGVCFAS
ncbi:MAG: hypothetical protein WC831_02065 [Parcubacteria group bacterium]|jgi:hypothetical protein